jgi:anti-sigma regulatory factor (Ser/Thr protein kinase)
MTALAAATAAEVIRRFPGRPEAAAAARDLCRSVLAGHPVGDVADLVVTELVANAVAYTRSGLPGGTVTVSVQCRADGVLIRVTDQGGPGAPTVTAAGPGAEHGRGLALVGALAARWGTAAAGRGVAVWALLGAA